MDFVALICLILFTDSLETGLLAEFWQEFIRVVPLYIQFHIARDATLGIKFFLCSISAIVSRNMTSVVISSNMFGRSAIVENVLKSIYSGSIFWAFLLLVDIFHLWNEKYPLPAIFYQIQMVYFLLTLLVSHLLVLFNRFAKNPRIELYVVLQACVHMYHINLYEGPAVMAEPLSPLVFPIYPRCTNPMLMSALGLHNFLFTSGTHHCDFPPCLN